MRSLCGLACLSLFILSGLAGSDVNSDDQQAWAVLADISGPIKGALPGETPVGWRLWSVQAEVFPAPESTAPPDSTGIYNKFRPLECVAQVQQPTTIDNKPQCELVFLNEPAVTYILKNGIYLRPGLIKAAISQEGIHLPQKGADIAREIKTEWRAIADGERSRYIAAMMRPIAGPSPQLFGLVAVHLITHENPKWLWATWIHQDYKDYAVHSIGLHDSFGVDAKGGVSEVLQDMLKAKNAPILQNYNLIGTQSDPVKTPRMGNPMIEGPHLGYASCMGCHGYASLRQDGSWPGPPQLSDLVGEVAPPSGRYAVDFAYSLLSGAKCHDAPGCKDAVSIQIDLQ